MKPVKKIKLVTLMTIASAGFYGCGEGPNLGDFIPSGQGSAPPTPPPSPPPPPPPPPPPTTTAPMRGTVIDVADLKPGFCGDTEEAAFLETVTIRSCEEPHNFEVAGVLTRPEGSAAEFPGRSTLVYESNIECRAVFNSHVGRTYKESPLEIDTITPSANSWESDDREVICLVVDVDGNMLDKPASDY